MFSNIYIYIFKYDLFKVFDVLKHLLRTGSNLYRRWNSKVRLFVIFRFEKVEKEYLWCFWRVSKRKNDGPLWRMCSRHANYTLLCIITLGLSWTTDKSSYCSRPTDICPIPRVLCPLSGLSQNDFFCSMFESFTNGGLTESCWR